jgi:hypothetical protein
MTSTMTKAGSAPANTMPSRIKPLGRGAVMTRSPADAIRYTMLAAVSLSLNESAADFREARAQLLPQLRWLG